MFLLSSTVNGKRAAGDFMPIPTVCPNCAAKLHAPDRKAGRKAKCPKCGGAVIVPIPSHKTAQPAEAPKWAEALPEVEDASDWVEAYVIKPGRKPTKAPPAAVPLAAEDDSDLEPRSRHEQAQARSGGFWIAIKARYISLMREYGIKIQAGIVCFVLGLVFLLCCCWPAVTSTSKSNLPRRGENGYLKAAGNDTVVLLGKDQKSYDELNRLALARDEIGIRRLIASGRVLSTPNRTKVLVIDPGLVTFEVRLLDGPYSGQSGIVDPDYLEK